MTFIQFTQLLKYLAVGFFLLVVVAKIILIEVYKRRYRDYIPAKIFINYSSIEIYGTDLFKRRKFMLRANKLTGWIYFALLFIAVAFTFPDLARLTGLTG